MIKDNVKVIVLFIGIENKYQRLLQQLLYPAYMLII